MIDDIDKVNYWYYKAADDDNKVALHKLGRFYEIGKDVGENLVRAFEFYKKSANRGCLKAQYKVVHYYDHGNVDKKGHSIYMKRLLKKEIVMHKKALLIYMNKVKEQKKI